MKFNRGFSNIALLLIFSLSAVIALNAQDNVSTEIKWSKEKEKIYIAEKKLQVIHFEGALHLSTDEYLPSYHKLINIESPGDNIILTNVIFDTLQASELDFIHHLILIKDTIIVHSETVYNSKKPYLSVSFIPLRKNAITGKYEKMVSFNISIVKEGKKIKQEYKTRLYHDNSVLASANWYKIAVSKTGVYKISYSDLQSAGVDLSVVSMTDIALFGNGGGMLPEANNVFRYDDLEENAIQVIDNNGNNSFDADDYILFFAESPHEWKFKQSDRRFHHIYNLYDEKNYYFLTFNHTTGSKKRIIDKDQPTGSATVSYNHFNDYSFYEKDIFNTIKKEMKSGKEWYGETFDITNSYNFPFYFPNLDIDSAVYIKTDFAVHCPSSSSFTVNTGGASFSVPLPPGMDYAASGNKENTFRPSGPNINIAINYNKPNSSSIGWLNYIELNAVRNLAFTGTQLQFRNINGTGSSVIAEYTLDNAGSGVTIWDVTNPLLAERIPAVQNGNTLVFKFFNDSIREYTAFNGNDFYSTESIVPVPNQNLHLIRDVDLVIVTPEIFLEQAQRLAELHRIHDNLSVAVVLASQVYNEFSSGRQDISAIRDMMKMMYDRAGTPDKLPRYLLLFGDASYDFKDRIPNNTNFIPSYESDESVNLNGTYVTDDYFALLDDNEGLSASGMLDIGVGRLPVFTVEQAKEAVDKIERYLELPDGTISQDQIPPLADWRNLVCFVADDGDNGEDFIGDAEQLEHSILSVSHNFNLEKIYCDAYSQVSGTGGQRYPDVTDAINRRVEKGALIINYVGHGGELGWAHERILKNSDINAWNNLYCMPLFVTATCEFSRYDDPERVAAGELVFLNPTGGGIGLYTTTRPTYGTPNITLSSKFYEEAFKKTDGIYPRLGDAIKKSKMNFDPINERKFALLGDPALRLAYPRFNVVTDSVNSHKYTITCDTLKGISKIKISGSVTDENGDIFNGFDGYVYPTVFDKPTKIISNGNDRTPVKTFYLQKNILYKGKISVKSGKFSFSFVVPKDIVYQYGFGNISYYAENGLTDANGRDSLMVGGFNELAPVDDRGPALSLFINDTNFKAGSVTDENPKLLAYLLDSSGINTTGNGIGHDIIAILDNETEKPFVLNDYYQSAENNFRQGYILYPFYNLSEGFHNLTLKAWDTYNNSSSGSIDFVVAVSAEIALQNILNFPNPFTDKTRFYFEHNQAGVPLEVEIRIFSINGEQIKLITKSLNDEGYVCNNIEWDGKNDYGCIVGKGVYVYKVLIRNSKGNYAEKVQKLVIIK